MRTIHGSNSNRYAMRYLRVHRHATPLQAHCVRPDRLPADRQTLNMLRMRGFSPRLPTNKKPATRAGCLFGGERGITKYIPVLCPSGSLRFAQSHSKFAPGEFVEPLVLRTDSSTLVFQQIKNPPRGRVVYLAEREGFEPSMGF